MLLISGATGSLGAAIVSTACKHGEKVIAISRGSLACENEFQPSGLVSKVYCDFAVQNSLEAAIPQIADAIGDTEAATFVHCAAVSTSGPVLALDADAMIEAMRINTLSWIQVTRGVLLQSRVKKLRVVLCNSPSGIVTAPYGGWYSACKHADRVVAKALAMEMGGQLEICIIEISDTHSAIWKNVRQDIDELQTANNRVFDQMIEDGRKRVARFLELSARHRLNTLDVAVKIYAVCRRKHVPFICLLGTQANIARAVSRMLPESVFIRIVRRLMRWLDLR